VKETMMESKQVLATEAKFHPDRGIAAAWTRGNDDEVTPMPLVKEVPYPHRT
jgi:hypothetical protein